MCISAYIIFNLRYFDDYFVKNKNFSCLSFSFFFKLFFLFVIYVFLLFSFRRGVSWRWSEFSRTDGQTGLDRFGLSKLKKIENFCYWCYIIIFLFFCVFIYLSFELLKYSKKNFDPGDYFIIDDRRLEYKKIYSFLALTSYSPSFLYLSLSICMYNIYIHIYHIYIRGCFR